MFRTRLQLLKLPASQTGTMLFLSTVLAHLTIAIVGPSSEGHLFSGDPLVELVCGIPLLVAPILALFAGIRGALEDRNDFFAYVSIGGGGFLTLMTTCGLVLALE